MADIGHTTTEGARQMRDDLYHQIDGIRNVAQILADMLDQALAAGPETVPLGVDREHLCFLYNDLCARATALQRAIV